MEDENGRKKDQKGSRRTEKDRTEMEEQKKDKVDSQPMMSGEEVYYYDDDQEYYQVGRSGAVACVSVLNAGGWEFDPQNMIVLYFLWRRDKVL